MIEWNAYVIIVSIVKFTQPFKEKKKKTILYELLPPHKQQTAVVSSKTIESN